MDFSGDPVTSSTRPALFKLDQVERHFGSKVVLEKLSVDILQSEFLCLLGASGCGKSTLLRLLAGLDVPDGGSLNCCLPISGVGLVFQEPNLLPWRSVLGNVELPLELKGIDKRDRRDKALMHLKEVGLHEAADRFPSQLSGGMRMRVSIARALVTEPELLLLDEPFSALDEITREDLDQYLRSLFISKKLTVVFVTHSILEATYLADRIIMMAPGGGRIIRDERIQPGYDGDSMHQKSPGDNEIRAGLSRSLRDSIKVPR